MEQNSQAQKPHMRRRYHPPETAADVSASKESAIEASREYPFHGLQERPKPFFFESPEDFTYAMQDDLFSKPATNAPAQPPKEPPAAASNTPLREQPNHSTPSPAKRRSYANSNSQSYQYPSQYSSQNTTQRPFDVAALKKRLPYYIGIGLCTVVLVASGTMLIRYYSQIHRANSATDQLRALYQEQVTSSPVVTETPASPPTPTPTPEVTSPIQQVTPAPTTAPVAAMATATVNDFLSQWPSKYPGNEQMRIQERFTPLRQQNRDVVGWLTIEGVVDEPVFQRDNSYYLTHDATGAKNPTGALFLDENCNLRTVPMQTLVHGHNMKEGAMFGSLKKYKVKDASFYREHPFIQFDSLYESATYVIFAVAEVNIVSGNTHYFPFWHQFSFDDYDSFRQYVSLAKEYSRFKVDIDVQPGDRLLTLATCSSGDDNLRLIVMARMLRENEDTIMLTNQIYSATAK